MKDTGAWAFRGCLDPDGINRYTSHPEKVYMAGLDGIMFGGAGSAFQFCRFGTEVLRIAAEWFAILTIPHVDDNIIVETQDAMASARRALVIMHADLGL